MRKTRQNRIILFLGDIALILMATQASARIRFETSEPSYHIFSAHTGGTTFTLLIYIIMFYVFDLYDVYQQFRPREKAIRTTAAVVSAGIVLGFVFYSLPHWEFGRGIFLIQMALVWCLALGWRKITAGFNRTHTGKQKVLIVGAGNSGKALLDLFKNAFSPYEAAGFLDDDPAKKDQNINGVPVLGKTDRLMEIAKETGALSAAVAITKDRPHALVKTILRAKLGGMAVHDLPEVFEDITGKVPVQHVREDWLVFSEGFNLISNPYLQKIKRLIDFSISGLLLLLSSPVILLTVIAIKLESPGPVFFKQERMGKGAKSFIAWKFRSMRQEAEKDGAAWASEQDPRVTRVGRIIRVFRIDELPQIYNVFRGDMSLIGPRPERPEFVRQLEEQIPYYGVRHSVRPGITGWAQINHPYGASVEDALKKLEYDVFYIKNMTLLLDAKIVLKTIGVIIFGQGAR